LLFPFPPSSLYRHPAGPTISSSPTYTTCPLHLFPLSLAANTPGPPVRRISYLAPPPSPPWPHRTHISPAPSPPPSLPRLFPSHHQASSMHRRHLLTPSPPERAAPTRAPPPSMAPATDPSPTALATPLPSPLHL
jgi:hypothetical protein